jgi:hypothetical protein
MVLGAHYGTSTGDLDGITDRPLTSVEPTSASSG